MGTCNDKDIPINHSILNSVAGMRKFRDSSEAT